MYVYIYIYIYTQYISLSIYIYIYTYNKLINKENRKRQGQEARQPPARDARHEGPERSVPQGEEDDQGLGTIQFHQL